MKVLALLACVATMAAGWFFLDENSNLAERADRFNVLIGMNPATDPDGTILAAQAYLVSPARSPNRANVERALEQYEAAVRQIAFQTVGRDDARLERVFSTYGSDRALALADLEITQ